LVDELQQLGWTEGQNLTFERIRQPSGVSLTEADYAPDVARLVQIPADVIVSGASQAIQAATHATQSIPIVMVNAGDPVGAGLVANLTHPGANVTGTSVYNVQLTAKRVELLAQIVPGLGRLAILNNPIAPNGGSIVNEARVAAEALSIAYRVWDVRSGDDWDDVFAAAKGWGADALLPPGQSPGPLDHAPRLARQSGLPVIYDGRQWVDAGGLVSYGVSLPMVFRRAAHYVDRVLRGANPAEMPVEQPTTFELVINRATLADLGLSIPESVRLQVTEWVP
jgi:putative ABC transport system substrate-binding protein